MKKLLILSAIICVCLTPAEAKKKKDKNKTVEPTVVLSNAVDSMSYALGLSIGTDMANNLENIPGGKYNTNLFLEGFTSSLKKDTTALMNKEYAQEYFQKYMMEAYEKETQAKKADGEKFLAENKLKDGVHETASGLQYMVITEGTGVKPAETDVVKVHYEGFLLDGTKFDSSLDRGEPIDFPLNRVIAGWTEGVQLMSVGSKYKFFIPYNLAYGENGAGGSIPPYATLIFDVELLEVTPSN